MLTCWKRKNCPPVNPLHSFRLHGIVIESCSVISSGKKSNRISDCGCLRKPTLLTINRRNDWIDAKIDLLDAQSKWVNTSAPRFSLFGQGFYGYPGFDYFASMQNHDWSWNALVGVRMVWNVSSLYTLRNNRQKIRAAQDIARVQKDVFLFNNSLLTDRQGGEIVRLRKALADDNRIVELRTAVRQAAESRFHNGVMDTYELLQKIPMKMPPFFPAASMKPSSSKPLYELKHTVIQSMQRIRKHSLDPLRSFLLAGCADIRNMRQRHLKPRR